MSSAHQLPQPAWANPNATPSSGHNVIINNNGGNSSMEQDMHEQEMFAPFSTLDEPVSETIMRDVNAVWDKLKIVLMPVQQVAAPFHMMAASQYQVVSQSAGPSSIATTTPAAGAATSVIGADGLTDHDREVISKLKDWDLWGPLVLCLWLAVLLSFKAPTGEASLVFAAVFMAVWVGGTVVTVNAQLLGGTISFFQSLCVLGYSIFPLTISALVIGMLRLVVHPWLWVDLLTVLAGFVWATRCSAVFIGLYVKPERRFLALYPVFFFYTFLSWMILLF